MDGLVDMSTHIYCRIFDVNGVKKVYTRKWAVTRYNTVLIGVNLRFLEWG